MGPSLAEEFSVFGGGETVQSSKMEESVEVFILDCCDVGMKACQRLLEMTHGRLREKHTLVEVPLRREGSTGKPVRKDVLEIK